MRVEQVVVLVDEWLCVFLPFLLIGGCEELDSCGIKTLLIRFLIFDIFPFKWSYLCYLEIYCG